MLGLVLELGFGHSGPWLQWTLDIYRTTIKAGQTFCRLSTSMSRSCFLKPFISSVFCLSSILLAADSCSARFFSPSTLSYSPQHTPPATVYSSHLLGPKNSQSPPPNGCRIVCSKSFFPAGTTNYATYHGNFLSVDNKHRKFRH